MNRPEGRFPDEAARRIRLVIFDVDGVLTDSGVYMGELPDGSPVELKRFDIQDGLAIKLLIGTGMPVALVSGRVSAATALRARELGIEECHQVPGAMKMPVVRNLLARNGVSWDEVAMLADDLPDLPVFRRVGLPVAVGNATPELVRDAIWQTRAQGGRGAVREFVRALLIARGEWENVVKGTAMPGAMTSPPKTRAAKGLTRAGLLRVRRPCRGRTPTRPPPPSPKRSGCSARRAARSSTWQTASASPSSRQSTLFWPPRPGHRLGDRQERHRRAQDRVHPDVHRHVRLLSAPGGGASRGPGHRVARGCRDSGLEERRYRGARRARGYLLRYGVPIVLMTGNPRSPLVRHATALLDCSVAEEACPLDLAPTTSTTAAMAMGDALAIVLLRRRGFEPADLAACTRGRSRTQAHPSGRRRDGRGRVPVPPRGRTRTRLYRAACTHARHRAHRGRAGPGRGRRDRGRSHASHGGANRTFCIFRSAPS